MDRAKVIFGNEMSGKDYRKALQNRQKFAKKFGDDSAVRYPLRFEDSEVITPYFGARNIVQGTESCAFPEGKNVVIGNIRMGFGHYRISIAMASAAAAKGYTPYWFDLLSFPDSTCSKIVAHQNDLYSLGSRLSQKYSLFNRLVWEPMNSEGFRKLSYNCSDQKVAELMAPVMAELPRDVPFISTHAWCAQAALHAGLTNVVSAVCDNWPMALHLAEGSVHAVQTPSAYYGYKTLRGMDKTRTLRPIPHGQIEYVGHFIDHEIVQGIEGDCARRLRKLETGEAKTYLLTVGGAGAQKAFFEGIIRHLLPRIRQGRAALLINFGDHKNVYEEMCRDIDGFASLTQAHFDDFADTERFFARHQTENISGIHAFCNSEIFAAVYATNLLMRISDVLITKPSELAFYPVPKLMIRRVGGHEAYGAIRASEVGDGTFECESVETSCAMLDAMEQDGDILSTMNACILRANKDGLYNGAYRIMDLLEQA